MSANLKRMVRVAKQQSRITPKLTGWLASHGEGVVVTDEETEALLLRLVKPGGSRSHAFHPSQLYQCPRRQVFDYYGVEGLRAYNPQLQNIFNDGTWRHMRWQIMLLNAGILDRVEVKVTVPELRLSGSMDGVNDTDGWMFELKGTSQFSTIKKNGVMPAHVKQVQTYLMAAELDSAVVVYEDKLSQNWAEFDVHRDEGTVREVTAILEVLNEAVDHERLPEMLDDCKTATGKTFDQCPYSHVCRESTDGHHAVALSQKV